MGNLQVIRSFHRRQTYLLGVCGSEMFTGMVPSGISFIFECGYVTFRFCFLLIWVYLFLLCLSIFKDFWQGPLSSLSYINGFLDKPLKCTYLFSSQTYRVSKDDRTPEQQAAHKEYNREIQASHRETMRKWKRGNLFVASKVDFTTQHLTR